MTAVQPQADIVFYMYLQCLRLMQILYIFKEQFQVCISGR